MNDEWMSIEIWMWLVIQELRNFKNDFEFGKSYREVKGFYFSFHLNRTISKVIDAMINNDQGMDN